MASQLSPEVLAQAEAFKDKGNEFFKNKHYEHALEEYTRAIELNPYVPSYFTNRAFAYIKTEAYYAAVVDANQAIELDKNFVKAYYRRASANMALGKFKDSRNDLAAVVRVCPGDEDAKKKLKECERIITQEAFLKAIYVESKPEKSPVQVAMELIPNIRVEASYDGPRFDEQITPEFMVALIAHLKAEKKLHKRYALQILVQAYHLLQSLPSLVDVKIPEDGKITVCGDTHGQFYDVLNIFELNGLPSESNPYLFNGDFVDRGSFSIEVILTFLGFKILYPDHFFMSRGNHETINMNKMYGFEGEVKAKYDAQMQDVFTDVFNWLPLCHVINNKIFVVHGGLFSQDDVTLDDIRAIKRDRQPPESGLMCDILWADPQPQLGRSPSKRGTGYQFGPDVTKRFLDANGLSLVVRSHEMREEGYDVMHDGKCITIFSAPNYVDQMGNKGAFITFKEDLVPHFTQFEAVPHPNVKPMQYASMYNMFGM